ncbi:hypothetical protein DFH27DRAFT_600514 [Peziza echinospora]|nr:hypothetical protein DFH27DRAFT_600514 [Peziza echinospora]
MPGLPRPCPFPTPTLWSTMTDRPTEKQPVCQTSRPAVGVQATAAAAAAALVCLVQAFWPANQASDGGGGAEGKAVEHWVVRFAIGIPYHDTSSPSQSPQAVRPTGAIGCKLFRAGLSFGVPGFEKVWAGE